MGKQAWRSIGPAEPREVAWPAPGLVLYWSGPESPNSGGSTITNMEHLMHARLEFAKRLALEAGRLTLGGHGRCQQMPKGGADGYDIATEFDLRTEELVRNRIADEYGEPLLGEEGGLMGDRDAALRHLWIVDPIDGTFNYQRGLPEYGVSIAYCRDCVPACGAIYLPVMDQLFYAAAGMGGYLVERGSTDPVRLAASREREVERLVISVAGVETFERMASWGRAGMPWRSLRMWLCAASSMAYVAAGRADAFVDRVHLWDCAAADILLREAGAPAVCDYGGVPVFPVYVQRHLELEHEGTFPCVAVSSREIWPVLMPGWRMEAGGLR